ncbi:hypothetical protein M0802_012623 [Mischocyttarus mexicanus]|nr:hypothetical protein M0802_012623 [Mischocyttarus mexicanus]
MNADRNSSAKDIFDQLFSRSIVQTLVSCTNCYGKHLFDTRRAVPRNTLNINFTETNKEELLKFLGLCLLQGQKKPILDNFQTAYSPSKALSLDESLLLFRGRLSFRQYILGKKARYCVKLFEPNTLVGYVLNIEIYEGKSHNIEKTSKTSSLVLRLMQPYLNKRHHLFMDNFYNSVELSKELLKHKTHTTGTLCPNRKGNPQEVTSKKLKKGEYIWRRRGQIYILKWRDKRDVLSITTNYNKYINI